MVLISATGWLMYQRQQSNSLKTAASIGIAVDSATPTPTPKTGDIAMQDVKSILGTPAPTAAAEWCEHPGQPQSLEGGVQFLECNVGTGEEAKPGQRVTVHYIGTLESNRTVFDNSYETGNPLSFTIGMGQVIPGFDIGVAGMRVGGKRKLLIPPDKAYGEQGSGSIPPNATLYFDVELLATQAVAQ